MQISLFGGAPVETERSELGRPVEGAAAAGNPFSHLAAWVVAGLMLLALAVWQFWPGEQHSPAGNVAPAATAPATAPPVEVVPPDRPDQRGLDDADDGSVDEMGLPLPPRRGLHGAPLLRP